MSREGDGAEVDATEGLQRTNLLLDAIADAIAEKVAQKVAPILRAELAAETGRLETAISERLGRDWEHRVFTRAEVAEILKASEDTVERLTARGHLRVLAGVSRPPRYAGPELRRYLSTFADDYLAPKSRGR